MSSFILKIIACICMFLDHYSDAIIGKFTFLNLIGRIAFPIFAYQTVQSYKHSKNIKKHLIKLFLFFLISEIPFRLFISTFSSSQSINVLMTFILAIISLIIFDKTKNKKIGFLFVIIISIINELIKADYGWFGILLVFNFYYFECIYRDKNKKLIMLLIAFLLCNLKYIPNMITNPNYINMYFYCGIFTSLSLVFISLYNSKEGHKLKYFFYIFYPLHLTVLYIIHNILLK